MMLETRSAMIRVLVERERYAVFIGTLKTSVWADYICETDG
jgi:hypothetical protein